MKRLIAPLLALCGLFSCSTDEDIAPDVSVSVNRTFMSVVDGIEVHIADIKDNQCYQFIVWRADGTRLVFSDFDTKGKWPKYEYSHYAVTDDTTAADIAVGGGQYEAFTMTATFNDDATEFVADYSGALRSDNIALVFEAKGAKFTHYWLPLDVNADGIPDVLQ